MEKKLSPEQYRVMKEKGTEAPFSGQYWNFHEKGMYKCAACGVELFSSDTKFDSGTGWAQANCFACAGVLAIRP